MPYCRVSFSVTSAMVASISTCSGMMSILCNMPSITEYSLGVAYIRSALFRRFARMRMRFSSSVPAVPASADRWLACRGGRAPRGATRRTLTRRGIDRSGRVLPAQIARREPSPLPNPVRHPVPTQPETSHFHGFHSGRGAPRRRRRRYVARREGALQQQFEIRTLAVLNVVDVPGPLGRVVSPAG